MPLLKRDTELIQDTIASNQDTKVTAIPGDAIVLANTFIDISHEASGGAAAGDEPQNSSIYIAEATTQLTAKRENNPSATLLFAASMAEYKAGIIVKQSGIITPADFTGGTADITINEVDLHRAWPIGAWLAEDASQRSDDCYTLDILNSNTLRVIVQTVNPGLELHWSIVQHPFLWVSKHTGLISGTSLAIDFAAEDYSKVLLFGSARMTIGTSFFFNEIPQIEVDQGNKQILISRRGSGISFECIIYSLEVCNNGQVDNISQNFPSGNVSEVVTFPKTLDPLRTTLHLNSVINRCLFGGNAASANTYRRGYMRVASFTDTQVTFTRVQAGTEADLSAQRWDHGTTEVYPILLRIEPSEVTIVDTALTLTIPLFPPNLIDNKTWVAHSHRSNHTSLDMNSIAIKSSRTGVNSLKYDRGGIDGECKISEQVIRFDPNIPVFTERGVITSTSSTPTPVTLGRTFNINKSWPYLTYEVVTGSLNANKAFSARLNGSNQIELQSASGNSGFSGAWQVVEYPYCNVTHISITPNGTSQDILVPEVTDWTKVLVMATSRRATVGSWAPDNVWTIKVDVIGEKLVVERTTSDGALWDLEISVINYTDGTIVDHVTDTIAAGTGFKTTTFASDCDVERTSLHFGSTGKVFQGRVEAGETNPQGCLLEIDTIGGFFTPDEIDINRGGNTAFAITYEIQRVQWALCQPELAALGTRDYPRGILTGNQRGII